MVRPCVARVFVELAVSGLASMYPTSDWSGVLLAIMDISARAISLADRPQPGHLGHQCSHAPGRPNLHLVSSSRRPRRVTRTIRLCHRELLIFRCSSRVGRSSSLGGCVSIGPCLKVPAAGQNTPSDASQLV